MGRVAKRLRAKRGPPYRPHETEPLAPFEDVVECGTELIYVIGYTSGGAPFGPRVEIVDGELIFLDEQSAELGPACGPQHGAPAARDSPQHGRDVPF